MLTRIAPTWLVIILTLFTADRATKELVRFLPTTAEGFFYLSYLPNTGLIFSLNLNRWVPLIIMPIALMIVGYLAWRAMEQRQTWSLLGSGLLIIGGGSNFYDRLAYGGVIDFIHLSILPIFNLADIYLLSGLILLLLFRHNQIYVS